MRLNRMTAAVLLAAASVPVLAAVPFKPTPNCVDIVADALYSLQPADRPDARVGAPPPAHGASGAVPDTGSDTSADTDAARESLAAYAVTLADIRYHRGGRAPKTGFDCSGFVHYVFAHALGIDLPASSASQFRYGTKVARDQLRAGDLVFFRTHGKRVSHVGIYLDGGRFIHAPSTGKRVRIDSLTDRYWSSHYAGARRAETVS